METKENKYPRVVEFMDGTFGVENERNQFMDLTLKRRHSWNFSSEYLKDCKGTLEEATAMYRSILSAVVKRVVDIDND